MKVAEAKTQTAGIFKPRATWEDYDAPSNELIARLRAAAPEGCLLCQLDETDGE
jgi:hypothetical protein